MSTLFHWRLDGKWWRGICTFHHATIEQTELQLESVNGPVLIPATSSALVTSGLQLIISSRSPTLVVDPNSVIISPTSLVASTIISIKIPLRLPFVSSIPLTAAPVTPSMIVTTKVTETSPSRPRSPRVIEVEKEFVVEIIDAFYKSLKQCIFWCWKVRPVRLSFWRWSLRRI